MASLIDDNAVLTEIDGAEFTVNYAMLYWCAGRIISGKTPQDKFPSAASASIDDAAVIASFSFLAHENLSCV